MVDKPTSLQVLLHAFPGIQEIEARGLVACGEIRVYPPDFVLCNEDVFETIFYIILEGEVKVTKIIDHQQVRLLKILKAGDFFGEMALIHNAPRAATVTTTAPTTVLEVRKANFDRFLQHSASLSLAMVREVSKRLRENDAMAIEDLRLKAGELATAYQRLAEQDYTRREFLTTIAHELRTPLTAANGFLQVIQKGQLDANGLQMALESITRNVQQITNLVNDFLFLQEMDLILSRFQKIDLGVALAWAVEQRSAQAAENHILLNLFIDPELPRVNGDQKSLERVFNALLDNAIKFSPNGGEVLIEARLEQPWVCVEVRDHGVGIPTQSLPHIFDRFFHIDQQGGHMFSGIGLGLSIARQVIEQHEGKIEVSSQVGKGSTFTVKLKAIG
jgi:signal transduction histidine kinase